MEVDLEQVSTEPETYRVRLAEDDGHGKRALVGRVVRQSANTWAFTTGEDQKADAVGITLTAETVAQLADVIATRFGTVEMPADRLSNETMERITAQMLHQLLPMAAHTGSIPGFTAALVHTFAHVIVDHIAPEREQEFRAHSLRKMDEEIATMRGVAMAGDAFRKTMGQLLERVESAIAKKQEDDDGSPTKH